MESNDGNASHSNLGWHYQIQPYTNKLFGDAFSLSLYRSQEAVLRKTSQFIGEGDEKFLLCSKFQEKSQKLLGNEKASVNLFTKILQD